jgi:hypothetical protein
MTKEQLQELSEKTNIQISKTYLYIANLKQGRNIDEIKTIEENTDWKKLMADKRNSEKLRNLRADQKEEREGQDNNPTVQTQIANNVQGILENNEDKEEDKEEYLSPVSEFDQKHPRLARIKNWFKDNFNKIKNRFAKDDYEEEYEEEYDEEPDEENTDGKNKRSKFLKSMTVADYDISKVAEKGMEEYLRTNKEENKSEVAKRILKNRQELYGKSANKTAIDDKLEKLTKDDEQNR